MIDVNLVHNPMRPLFQPWHAAITQVAPPDLGDFYLCVAFSFGKPDVPLCTAADICLDESIVIYISYDDDDTDKAIRRLGVESDGFMKYGHCSKLFKKYCRMKQSKITNRLVPLNANPWYGYSYRQVAERLDAGEYLWVRDWFSNATPNFEIQGFLQSH